MIEEYEVLDITFSDTHVYPSLKEVELCSDLVIQKGKRERDTYKRLYMDNYIPRLRLLGRLSTV